MKFKLALPDLVSNSYFPAIAAIELGLFRAQGLDVDLELIFPIDKAYAALRDRQIDIVAGSAHSAVSAFRDWNGVKLVCAQAQNMYWFLVVRTDLAVQGQGLEAIRNVRIGAAPWVEQGLRVLLAEAGKDISRDRIKIGPVPGATPAVDGSPVNFGLMAAKALEDGAIDGFWANGMGAEIAVRAGYGKVVLDVRRGDGPPGCIDYTFASIAMRSDVSPEIASAVEKAMAAAQTMLRTQPALSRDVARNHFPAAAQELIEDLIRRDIPYYQTHISRSSFNGMIRFQKQLGIIGSDPRYEDVVSDVAMSS